MKSPLSDRDYRVSCSNRYWIEFFESYFRKANLAVIRYDLCISGSADRLRWNISGVGDETEYSDSCSTNPLPDKLQTLVRCNFHKTD
jgi:hypothetical protein